MPCRQTARLLCHPATPCPAVERIEVEVELAAGGLALSYRLSGRPELLRLPSPRPSGPCDGLWQHTCCEAFIAVVDDPGYREFNFSPSGQWAAYAFADYRRRQPHDPGAAPRLELQRAGEGLRLDAFLPSPLLPQAAGAALALGLAAVLEAADGTLSYWALAHPAARPDFHDRAGFVLRLPQTESIS